MISEVVWLAGATSGYSEECKLLADPEYFDLELDASLGLLKLLPERGSCVPKFGGIGKIKIGKWIHLGVFYSVRGDRLFIHALLDLRQDPIRIESKLRRRLP